MPFVRVVPVGSLAAAVLAAVWLITAPASATPASAAAPGPAVGPLTVGRRWPQVDVVDAPGTVEDGAAFQPLLYIDASTAVGTAPTPDGRAVRLLVRNPAGERPLQRVAQDHQPEFLGLTVADGVLFWAELTVEPSGAGSTRIWRAPLDGSAGPAVLTAEAGAAVFFESQYDLVVAEGRVHWVAAAPGDTLVTEVRSVPVGGGRWAVAGYGSTGRLVLLADAAGQVLGRDGVLWWSTGEQEALLWHSLDLRTVPR